MNEKNPVICASNSYIEKVLFNEYYNFLGEDAKQHIKAVCVSFTEKVGGIFIMSIDANYTITLENYHDENDFYYDNIEANLEIDKLKVKRADLFKYIVKATKDNDIRN